VTVRLAQAARRRVAYGEVTDELRELVGMDDRLAMGRRDALQRTQRLLANGKEQRQREELQPRRSCGLLLSRSIGKSTSSRTVQPRSSPDLRGRTQRRRAWVWAASRAIIAPRAVRVRDRRRAAGRASGVRRLSLVSTLTPDRYHRGDEPQTPVTRTPKPSPLVVGKALPQSRRLTMQRVTADHRSEQLRPVLLDRGDQPVDQRVAFG
jgi:hypothetical protein